MLQQNIELRENYINFLEQNGVQIPPIPLEDNYMIFADYWTLIYQQYLDLITQQGGNLPANLPIEPHPYIYEYPIQNLATKLIIGTMPPISHMAIYNPLINLIPPFIPFFHGNMRSLWGLIGNENLLNQLENNLLNENDLIQFLWDNDCTISDIIGFCQRNAPNANDTNLFNIIPNTPLIHAILSNESNINSLIFTNSVANGASGIRIRQNNGNDFIGAIKYSNRDALSLFLRSCQIISKRISLKLIEGVQWLDIKSENAGIINQLFNNKIVFLLRIYISKSDFKDFTVYCPPSPSGIANIGLVNNQINLNYQQIYGQQGVNQFKSFVWQNSLAGNIDALIPLH